MFTSFYDLVFRDIDCHSKMLWRTHRIGEIEASRFRDGQQKRVFRPFVWRRSQKLHDCCGFHVTERERERRREKKRKRSHGADDKNLARRAPCCTRHGGWRFPRRDGKQHLGPNEADEGTDANANGWHHAGAEREDAESADGLQPRRKHYRPQRSSAFRDHADELLVSKHAKKQRVFDLERRYFNELLPVRENVHLFIILVFLRWFGRCIEWERDQLRQGCLGN